MSDPLGLSQYPREAVELTVTFLIPVTDENRQEVDGPLDDALKAATAHLDVEWWTDKFAHYVDNRRQMEVGYVRPPQWKRPKPKPLPKAAS